MAELVVIRGLPGSGKSTAAKKLMGAGHTFLEADMFYVDKDGKYKFEFEKKGQASRDVFGFNFNKPRHAANAPIRAQERVNAVKLNEMSSEDARELLDAWEPLDLN